MCKNVLASLIATLLLWAAASAQTPLLENERFEMVLHPEARVVNRFDDGWETRMVVEHQGQQVRINWKNDQALLLFPTSTWRFKTSSTRESTSITVHLDGQRHEVKTNSREVGWLLPDQEVFFKTYGGKVTQVVGTSDFLKLRRDTRSGRLTLESSVGVTDALINDKGQLETFSGPEFGEHLYLVRGLAFRQGPVTVRIPLPQGPFLDALPSERYLTVVKELEPLEKPAAAAPPEERPDPLQAEPATWDSPELRAKFNDPSEDPLSVKKERRVKYEEDPLKAKTAEDSEELLRVKDY